MNYNGRQLTEPQDILDAFADFFSKSYTPPSDADTESHNSSPSSIINLLNFSEVEVLAVLKRIKPKMTTGPDGVPAFLLKDCAYVLAHPLKILFNMCINNCRLPEMWKRSKVCPIFKKGDKYDIANFRPISIICNFCKAFEILLHNFLNHYLARKITCSQHGFMKGRSTTTNLVCITQFIAESIDNHMQTDVIYTDFSKAFDRLDHSILLNKLNHFGLSDTLIRLFSSLLHNRVHYVMYNGFKSAEYIAASGVPQGSILGPLLFIIFINDIADLLDSKCLLYADDLKIYRTIGSIADCILIQRDLDKVYNWCKNNKLPLNVAKCNAMSFTLKSSTITFDYHIADVTLTRPTSFRDLGVVFDGKLSFTTHIETITSEASKIYGFIARNGRDFSNVQTLKMLYFTFVRSKLEYASVVWCPNYTLHINSIESVQRRFLKLLSFKLDNVYPCIGFPQVSLLDRHSAVSLEKRREYSSQVLLFKVVNSITDCQEILAKLNFIIPRATSRANLTFYLPTPRTNILKYSPIYVMCKICDSSNTIDIFGDSLMDLKNAYK